MRRDILDISVFSVLTISTLRIIQLNIDRSDAKAKDSLGYSLAFRLRVSFELSIR